MDKQQAQDRARELGWTFDPSIAVWNKGVLRAKLAWSPDGSRYWLQVLGNDAIPLEEEEER